MLASIGRGGLAKGEGRGVPAGEDRIRVPPQQKSVQQTIQELWELLRAYATQETVAPLKSLGRGIGFGLAGSFCFTVGVFLAGIGLVRLFDTHVSFLRDHSYLAYLIVAVVWMLVIAVVAARLRPAAPNPEGRP